MGIKRDRAPLDIIKSFKKFWNMSAWHVIIFQVAVLLKLISCANFKELKLWVESLGTRELNKTDSKRKCILADQKLMPLI